MKVFDARNNQLTHQFEQIRWDEASGLEPEVLAEEIEALSRTQNRSRALLKAETFALILDKSRIALDVDDIFQDKLFGSNFMAKQRSEWEREIKQQYLPEETEEINYALNVCGAYWANGDYGHTSPNSRLLLEVGFPGLLQRISEAAQRENLTRKQKDFYASCRIVLEAIIRFIQRLADAIRPINAENSIALENIAKGAPQNIYEAMQLIIIYFFLHEYVSGTRVRTLGRLDVLLTPFYENDLQKGTYTKQEITEMLKFFLNKFWAAKVPFDLPFCLGGLDADGNEVTNDVSYLIVKTYNSLDIHSPKIHIRVSEKTPKAFVKLVLQCIRGGNSSFVFVNDAVTVKGLTNVGIEPEDALDYVPIGCYEPAVWGKEIGCTGNGGVNVPKAVELVMTDGICSKTGRLLTIDTGTPESFLEFVDAVKKQIAFMADRSMQYIQKIEGYYDKINPDPLLSSMYEESVKRGVDVYEGGAKYNNSSLYFYCIGSLIDAVMAVKKLVFDEKRVTFNELREILKNNWSGHENLRTYAKSLSEKYGNGNKETDAVAKELIEFCASLVNNRPNGRGGVFKAALFCIDRFIYYGEKTMATPDGRYSGEPLSKNLCATIGMDRNGITGLINSVTSFDHSLFPNGSVLDVILHPSAVQGESGLEALYGILKTYMLKGGFAMHGNIFNVEDLKAAQKEPEKYKNLQVRVCGWNAYFVDLTKTEQDLFIKQAELV